MLYQQAQEIALRVLKALQPYCLVVDVAGSIRREKPEVKDIEICALPRITEEKDLFGEVIGKKRNAHFVATVKSLGAILKGSPENGRYVQVALKEGINVDLFIPQEQDYTRQYAIRTGSADYSHKVLATAWLKKGWAGTKDGLRLQSECYQKVIGTYPDGREKKEWICNVATPTLPPIFETEYHLFQWLNLEWKEPSKRYV